MSKNNAENAPFVVFVYVGAISRALLSYTITARGDFFFRSFDNGVWRYQRYEDESNNQAPRLLCTQSLTPEFGGAWMAKNPTLNGNKYSTKKQQVNTMRDDTYGITCQRLVILC